MIKKQREIKYLKEISKTRKETTVQRRKLIHLTDTAKGITWDYFSIEELDTTREWYILQYDFSNAIVYKPEAPENYFNFLGFI